MIDNILLYNKLKKIKNANVILVVISLIFIFFSHIRFISGSVHIIIAILIFLVVILSLYYMYKFPIVKIDIYDLFWFMYDVVLLFHMFYTPYLSEGRQYFFYFTMVGILLIYLKSTYNWEKLFLKVIHIFSFVHSFFIILQAVFPDLVMAINKELLSVDTYDLIQRSYSYNYHSGITNQPAAAGMFSVVFIGVVFSKLLTTTRYKKLIYLQFIMGIIAVFLTQKRSFLIALFVAMGYLLLAYNDRTRYKKLVRMFLVSTIILSLTTIILLLVPAAGNVLEKLFKDDDLVGPRSILYDTLIQWFKSNRLWGVGLGASQTTFGYGGHNIYLQILAETGIIGFILFFFAFIGQIFSNIKRSKCFFKLFSQSKEDHYSLVFTIFMQVVILVYGFSGNPIFDYPFFLLIIFILAIPNSVFRYKNMKSPGIFLGKKEII